MKNRQVGAKFLHSNRQKDRRSKGHTDIHDEADGRFKQLLQPSNVQFNHVWS
jgi:hypothetical protein